MTIEEMKRRKQELGYTYEQIASLSGLPVGTVQKVLGGITQSPRYDTLRALESIFQTEDAASYRVCESSAYSIQDIPGEEYHDPVLCKQQGEYTVEDYFAITDDKRRELIDGVLYDMASPLTIHQILVTRIWYAFEQYITSKAGSCVPLVSPIDVEFLGDDKTIVQPDVLVVCDRDKLQRHIYGTPDLAVEVLSPSSRKRDNQIKLRKYMEAGVKEYWIVDPVKRKIIVYNFVKEEWPVIYSFRDRIPVDIFPEPCEIDFSQIDDYVSFLYEE